MTQITFDEVAQILPAISKFPRTALFTSATPLDQMPRVSDHFGQPIDIKRDDYFPLAMGGNKVRQLEFYLGQARVQGADTVLITGAVQSNFVRLCAAAARQLGWRPVVQLESRVPKNDHAYETSGNVLLLKILGAEIHNFSGGGDEAAADANLDRIASKLKDEGANPYVIHLGIDHPPYGALGYAAAAAETFLQAKAADTFPDCIVVPSGSGLTHAGFLVGARAIGWDVPIYGICVRRDKEAQAARISNRAKEVAELLGCIKLKVSDVDVSDAVLAPGYGQMNDEVRSAISLVAQHDAILLDPVYSGRTFAGLISHLNSGKIAPLERVLFVHTGGTPAIFAYESELGS